MNGVLGEAGHAALKACNHFFYCLEADSMAAIHGDDIIAEGEPEKLPFRCFGASQKWHWSCSFSQQSRCGVPVSFGDGECEMWSGVYLAKNPSHDHEFHKYAVWAWS